MKVVFLDIDGALNDGTRHHRTQFCTIDRACAARLDRILVEADAHIVLISAWRYLYLCGSMTLDGLRNMLHSHWIDGNRLIGVTRKDGGHMMPGGYPACDRPQQIHDWLKKEGWSKPRPDFRYVVIDNMDFEDVDGVDLGMVAAGHPFVKTDGNVGLTDADADRAIAILNGAHPERSDP